jgi:hypothetical protein
MPAPSARRLVLPPVWATTADGSFTATVVHADQCWAIEALAPGSRRTAAPELASLALDELVVRALRTGRYWGPGGLLAANDVADAVLIGKVRVLDDVVRHGLPEGDQLREWAVLQRLHDSSIVLAALSRRQYGENQTVMAYLARLVQLAQRKVAKEPTTMILPHGMELNLTYAVVPAIAQRGRPRTSLPTMTPVPAAAAAATAAAGASVEVGRGALSTGIRTGAASVGLSLYALMLLQDGHDDGKSARRRSKLKATVRGRAGVSVDEDADDDRSDTESASSGDTDADNMDSPDNVPTLLATEHQLWSEGVGRGALCNLDVVLQVLAGSDGLSAILPTPTPLQARRAYIALADPSYRVGCTLAPLALDHLNATADVDYLALQGTLALPVGTDELAAMRQVITLLRQDASARPLLAAPVRLNRQGFHNPDVVVRGPTMGPGGQARQAGQSWAALPCPAGSAEPLKAYVRLDGGVSKSEVYDAAVAAARFLLTMDGVGYYQVEALRALTEDLPGRTHTVPGGFALSILTAVCLAARGMNAYLAVETFNHKARLGAQVPCPIQGSEAEEMVLFLHGMEGDLDNNDDDAYGGASASAPVTGAAALAAREAAAVAAAAAPGVATTAASLAALTAEGAMAFVRSAAHALTALPGGASGLDMIAGVGLAVQRAGDHLVVPHPDLMHLTTADPGSGWWSHDDRGHIRSSVESLMQDKAMDVYPLLGLPLTFAAWTAHVPAPARAHTNVHDVRVSRLQVYAPGPRMAAGEVGCTNDQTTSALAARMHRLVIVDASGQDRFRTDAATAAVNNLDARLGADTARWATEGIAVRLEVAVVAKAAWASDPDGMHWQTMLGEAGLGSALAYIVRHGRSAPAVTTCSFARLLAAGWRWHALAALGALQQATSADAQIEAAAALNAYAGWAGGVYNGRRATYKGAHFAPRLAMLAGRPLAMIAPPLPSLHPHLRMTTEGARTLADLAGEGSGAPLLRELALDLARPAPLPVQPPAPPPASAMAVRPPAMQALACVQCMQCFGSGEVQEDVAALHAHLEVAGHRAPPDGTAGVLAVAYARAQRDTQIAGLNQLQRAALDAVKAGLSIFVSGGAGVGKTHVVRLAIAELVDCWGAGAVAVTAMTGVASANIGGVTLYSWAGIGRGEGDADALTTAVLRSQSATSNWLRAKVLVIDEVSMLSDVLLTKLAKVACRVRGVNAPFGGLQVILVGYVRAATYERWGSMQYLLPW